MTAPANLHTLSVARRGSRHFADAMAKDSDALIDLLKTLTVEQGRPFAALATRMRDHARSYRAADREESAAAEAMDTETEMDRASLRVP